MHPVTRLGRVVQQLRSFGDLHGAELEALAASTEDEELAAKLRAVAAIQRDEAQLVVDELVELQGHLAEPAEQPEEPHEAAIPPEQAWKASPKRAQWLAENARPRNRRELFRRS